MTLIKYRDCSVNEPLLTSLGCFRFADQSRVVVCAGQSLFATSCAGRNSAKSLLWTREPSRLSAEKGKRLTEFGQNQIFRAKRGEKLRNEIFIGLTSLPSIKPPPVHVSTTAMFSLPSLALFASLALTAHAHFHHGMHGMSDYPETGTTPRSGELPNLRAHPRPDQYAYSGNQGTCPSLWPTAQTQLQNRLSFSSAETRP